MNYLLMKGKSVESISQNWLVSEKLDGVRAWWDGGVSRGLITCPWRNTRTGKRQGRADLLPCTGLWTSNGNPIQAPGWWLDQLPKHITDGELWSGYNSFQFTIGTVKRLNVDTRCDDSRCDDSWRQVRYKIFDAPTCDQMFVSRVINTPTCKMVINRDACNHYYADVGADWESGYPTFEDRIPLINIHLDEATAGVDLMKIVASRGGEGLIYRNPKQFWVPARVGWVRKEKPRKDAEGWIIDINPGKGKYDGMMGSLRVRWGLVAFDISGFTNQEREPGVFQIGDRITFSYRELSDVGVPKEAQYMRKDENQL